MTTLAEADVEQAALEWLCGLGWQQILHSPDIAPDIPNAERDDYGQVVLDGSGNTCNLRSGSRTAPTRPRLRSSKPTSRICCDIQPRPRHHSNMQTARRRPVEALQRGRPVRNGVARDADRD